MPHKLSWERPTSWAHNKPVRNGPLWRGAWGCRWWQTNTTNLKIQIPQWEGKRGATKRNGRVGGWAWTRSTVDIRSSWRVGITEAGFIPELKLPLLKLYSTQPLLYSNYLSVDWGCSGESFQTPHWNILEMARRNHGNWIHTRTQSLQYHLSMSWGCSEEPFKKVLKSSQWWMVLFFGLTVCQGLGMHREKKVV